MHANVLKVSRAYEAPCGGLVTTFLSSDRYGHCFNLIQFLQTVLKNVPTLPKNPKDLMEFDLALLLRSIWQISAILTEAFKSVLTAREVSKTKN